MFKLFVGVPMFEKCLKRLVLVFQVPSLLLTSWVPWEVGTLASSGWSREREALFFFRKKHIVVDLSSKKHFPFIPCIWGSIVYLSIPGEIKAAWYVCTFSDMGDRRRVDLCTKHLEPLYPFICLSLKSLQPWRRRRRSPKLSGAHRIFKASDQIGRDKFKK